MTTANTSPFASASLESDIWAFCDEATREGNEQAICYALAFKSFIDGRDSMIGQIALAVQEYGSALAAQPFLSARCRDMRTCVAGYSLAETAYLRGQICQLETWLHEHN